MIIYKFIVIVLFLVILQNTYIIFKINSGCCEFKDVGAIDIVMLTYSRVKFMICHCLQCVWLGAHRDLDRIWEPK